MTSNVSPPVLLLLLISSHIAPLAGRDHAQNVATPYIYIVTSSKALSPPLASTTTSSTSWLLVKMYEASPHEYKWRLPSDMTRPKFQIRLTLQCLRPHTYRGNLSINPVCFSISTRFRPNSVFQGQSLYKLIRPPRDRKAWVMQSRSPPFHQFYGNPSPVPTNVNKRFF